MIKQVWVQNLKILLVITGCFTWYSTVSQSLMDQKYFDNEAKNYAVITAKYATIAYHFSKDVSFGFMEAKSKLNSDSAIIFINKGIIAADSCISVAPDTAGNDSVKLGLMYIELAKQELIAAKKQLYKTYYQDDVANKMLTGESGMYQAGNAIVDAYNASFYFTGNKVEEPIAKAEESNTEVSAEKKQLSLEAQRLEADEATFTSIVGMYEQKVGKLNNKITTTEEEIQKVKDAIEKNKMEKSVVGLKEELAILEGKMNNAVAQLKLITDELSELIPKEIAASSKNAINKNTLKPKKATFSMDKYGFYGPANPIPLDDEVEYPNGLLYRIQIGYFSKENDPKWAKGLYPIGGETVSNNYIRYTTGLFFTIEQAEDALTAVREQTTKDAFVVAYFDGKRIPVSQAIRTQKTDNSKNY